MADAITNIRRRAEKARHDAEGDLHAEIASLKAEIASITEAVADLEQDRFGDLRHDVSDRFDDFRHGAADAVDEVVGAVRHNGRRAARQARRGAREVRSTVEQNPVPALALVGGVLLIAAFIGARRR